MSLKVILPPRLPSFTPTKIVSMKQEIDIHVAALKAYDAGEYEVALQTFGEIADSSRILFNMGMIHATIGEHKQAVSMYIKATKLDQYLAVAYFQEGVSNFLLGEFGEALGNFNDALLYLRGNLCINYEQLGLKFRLFSCEVLFNRGLSYIYLGDMEQGMKDLEYALKEKQTEEHTVIDEAIRDKAEAYTVFSVPVGVIYRPSEAKIKNAQKKDYLGEAKLIAATDARDGFTGFTGAEIKKAQEPVQSPPTSSSTPFATHEMVKTDIVSSKSIRRRSRSDAGPTSLNESRRDRFQKPFPLKSGPDRDMPKNLPPTPPSESESYSLQRSRSRSQPAAMRSTTRSSSESSEYNPVPRSRLNTVRDEDERGGIEMRRARSMGGRGVGAERRKGEERKMNRSMSTRQAESSRRRDYGDDIYDLYNDYYDEKPVTRSLSTRRPLARTLTRTRTSSSSRGRSRDVDDDYSNRYSDGEDEDFEMITPKRSEISKIKVKVTMNDTARIVMIPVDIEIEEFTDRVAAKFNVPARKLKCKFLDEDGQELDLCDQDEMEMLIELAKEEAKLNRHEFGRAEVTFDSHFPFRA